MSEPLDPREPLSAPISLVEHRLKSRGKKPTQPLPSPNDEPSNDAPVNDGGKRKKEEPKLADRIVQLVLAEAELFHDSRQVGYACVVTKKRRAIHKIRSRAMRIWISFVSRPLGCVNASSLEEAILNLEGIALHEREEKKVHLRIAEHEGSIYVDLGDDAGRCVEVTRTGWTVLDASPVMFRRPDAMRPLPVPVAGGSVSDLRPFLNVELEGFVLFVAWIVAAYRVGRPYTILTLSGEQGAAKSTTSRVARDLVDPNAVPLRSPPKNEDDLVVGTAHSHVIAYDNLSGVTASTSDALCRLSTGGGLTKRALYSDDDEIAIEAVRPIIINGIDDLASRADLAERSILLELQPVTVRKSERAFRADFDAAAPRILGAILDGVSSALDNIDGADETNLPRMADFAMWSASAEPGLGFPPGTIAKAYAKNRERAIELTLQSSPVVVALRALLARPSTFGAWEGQPEQLLAELGTLTAEPTRRMSSWPKNAASLSRALRRAATFLRTVGIMVDLDGSTGRGADKSRLWSVTRVTPRATGDDGDAWGRN